MTEPTASPSLSSLKDKVLDKAEQWVLDAGNLSAALQPFIDHESNELGILQMKLDAIHREAKRILANAGRAA